MPKPTIVRTTYIKIYYTSGREQTYVMRGGGWVEKLAEIITGDDVMLLLPGEERYNPSETVLVILPNVEHIDVTEKSD